MRLTHPVTGHQIRADESSVKFWEGAGYRAEKPADEPKKAPAKKAAPKKSTSK